MLEIVGFIDTVASDWVAGSSEIATLLSERLGLE